MTSEQLRILAASESAYVASRMVTYREDGATPPDAIRRLGTLADAVLSALPGLGAQQDTATLVERAERAELIVRAMRVKIYDIHLIAEGAATAIDDASKTLADPVPTLTGKGQDVATVEAANPSTVGSTSLSPPVVSLTMGGAADGISCLRHGIVLTNATGERRLFSEPMVGQWAVQTVAPDGLTAGEPFSTTPEKWTNGWYESPLVLKPALRRYDEELRPPTLAPTPKAPKSPAADRTLALPGMADIAPTPQKTIKDYAPDDAQFATWTNALNKGAKTTIDEGKVRDCFVSWQIDNRDEVKPNPAALFWHHAKKTLVPATT